MAVPDAGLVVLFEHDLWQLPLFEVLDRRGVPYAPFDLKRAAFSQEDPPAAPLYLNRASPSAYIRGNARTVPFALALLRHLEARGVRVLNGSGALALELSKSAQVALLTRLGVDHPTSIVFNDVDALRDGATRMSWPAILKPEQGGCGARVHVVESMDALEALLFEQEELWLPDNLLLLQEYIPHHPERGIVRMEFVGGEFLYAVRVISHGHVNLCPSEVCNPVRGPRGDPGREPGVLSLPPAEFHPCLQLPEQVVETGRRIVEAAGLDLGGIEYVEAEDGRVVFFDINANSNLRPSVARAFGFDPFDRVVDFLVGQLERVGASWAGRSEGSAGAPAMQT